MVDYGAGGNIRFM